MPSPYTIKIKQILKILIITTTIHYWGPNFNDEEILKTINTFKLNYKISKNIYKETAIGYLKK